MMKSCVVALAFGLAGVACAEPAKTVRVSVDAADVKAEVSPWIYGLGMEDVNHEIYGGLDAQRLFGESFEEPPEKPWGPLMSPREPSRWWTASVGGAGAVTCETENPHGGKAAQRLSPRGCSASVENAGLNGWGVNCVKGRTMRGWLYARGETGSLSVSLRSAGGKVLASAKLEAAPGAAWKRMDFTLTPDETDPKARFRIMAEGYGDIVVDDAYLADVATDAFGKIGCRSDIVKGFEAAGVNFLRWGGTAVNVPEYRLKAFPEDDSRPPYDGFWYSYASGGFGPRQFVRLADAMKVACALAISVDEDLADAAAFAAWTRQFEGFIAVQIGNEEMSADAVAPEGYRQYCRKARTLVEAMRKENPRLKFVSAAWWRSNLPAVMEETFRALDGVMDYQDLHPWFGGHDKPGRMTFENARKSRQVVAGCLKAIRAWNPQTTMRVAVLEENGKTHGMDRALAHAVMLEAVREAGKDVLTTCQANALQPYRQNDNGWNQGNVFFTPDKVWLQPNAYAMRMAADFHRDLLVSGTTDDDAVSVSATKSRDGKSVVLHLVNATDAPRQLELNLSGVTATVAKVVELAATSLADENTPDEPTRVAPRDITEPFASAPVLKPYSYTVVELKRRDQTAHGVLCLTFDDRHFASWEAALPVFEKYGAHASFFVAGAIDAEALKTMRRLRAEGHTVGIHTVGHGNAPTNAAPKEIAKWFDAQVEPQLKALRAADFPVWSLAYPNNRHDEAVDRYVLSRTGFTHLRAGARGIRYNFKGDVTPETIVRFDTVETAYKPVEWVQWKPGMNGIGIGPVYCYSRENVFRALRRAAERNEMVTFFSHSIKPSNTDWVGMRTEWLEEILAEAKRLEIKVIGFDDL